MTARPEKSWLAGVGTKPLFIEPGSPWENGYCESFNGKLRDECLNGEIFYSLKEALLSQGCGGGISGFYSIDIRNPHHPLIRQTPLSNTDTAGIWGRSGPVIGKNGRVYGTTADGKFDPLAGDYSNSVVAASLLDLSLTNYFTPANWAYTTSAWMEN